jgi:hypothetical protein
MMNFHVFVIVLRVWHGSCYEPKKTSAPKNRCFIAAVVSAAAATSSGCEEARPDMAPRSLDYLKIRLQ